MNCLRNAVVRQGENFTKKRDFTLAQEKYSSTLNTPEEKKIYFKFLVFFSNSRKYFTLKP